MNHRMKKNLNLFIAAVVFIFIAASCKTKKKEATEKFFPVLSFIKSQVADVDTSLFSIRKYVFIDSLRTDTVFINRGQFRQEAQDFLSIPDLAASKYADRYKEEKQFDESLNRVMITYLPINPDKEEIQRQEVLIHPDPGGTDKVTNIIINRIINTKDSSVEKRLLWKVDESFQVTTIRQLVGQPETISTFKVAWNEQEQ